MFERLKDRIPYTEIIINMPFKHTNKYQKHFENAEIFQNAHAGNSADIAR
jgi:hypothetical protein